MDKYTEYKLQQSNAIQDVFEKIKLHLGFQLLSAEEKSFFGEIPLFFSNHDFSVNIATAHGNEMDISFNLGSECNARFVKTLIHEIAHIICFRYYPGYMKHTLEFAIVNYCLLHKYYPDYSEFFRSYDIHEDKAYKYISINPSQFDDFIKSIQWDTLEELTKRAKFLAMKIRNKQAFFTTTHWEKEFEQIEKTL